MSSYRNIYYGILIIYIVIAMDYLFSSLFGINAALIRYLLYSVSLYLIMISSYNLKSSIVDVGKSNIKIIRLLLFWTTLIIIRDITDIFSSYSNYLYLKRFISGQVLIYCITFLVLLKPNLFLIKKLLKLALILSYIYLAIVLINFKSISSNADQGAEYYGVILASSASLIFLTSYYHSARVKFVSILVLLLALLLSAIFARRNQVVYFSLIIFASSYIMITYKSQITSINQRATNLLSIILFVVMFIIIILSFTLKFGFLEEKLKSGFSSREDVFFQMKDDFNSKPYDWFIGRGMNGGYNSNMDVDGSIRSQRELIESGYLQLILKGGYIYVFLVVILSLIAFYLGFFKSSNLLAKAFAVITAINLIDMIGYGLPSLSLKYIVLWLGIGFCLSKEFRNMPDITIKRIVGLK